MWIKSTFDTFLLQRNKNDENNYIWYSLKISEILYHSWIMDQGWVLKDKY